MNTLKLFTVIAILLCGAASAHASTRPGAQGTASNTEVQQRCAIGHEAPHASKPTQGAARKLRMKTDAKRTGQSCLLFRKQLREEDLKSEDTMADVSGRRQGEGNSL